ncbi:LysR family transcriptional regulator [Pseudomonas palmensis]|uniref:LysR family transcriptional regulator n=1 Tax=Pseudomonas palmensis TaxID=2815362 RepID=UPI001AE8D04B|nr:LysR family transcriptional regulator [Pseudomonas palmensis]
MINPQWLKSFAVLAELGNFTRTAEYLGLTQAAVSQHIRNLEQQFGTLFLRHHRHVELTPIGSALLDYNREMERAGRALDARLRASALDVGDVSFVTPGSIGLALYPLLLDYQQAHPGITVRHRFAPDTEVLEAVLSNRFEIGLLTYKPDNDRIKAEKFAEEPLELILPAATRYAGYETLVELGFINHPDGIGMATRLLSRKYPGSPSIREIQMRGFSNQVNLILEPVSRGLGFTVLPRFAKQAFHRQEALQVVECGNPVVDTLWLICRSEWPLSSRASRVVDELKQHLEVASRRA